MYSEIRLKVPQFLSCKFWTDKRIEHLIGTFYQVSTIKWDLTRPEPLIDLKHYPALLSSYIKQIRLYNCTPLPFAHPSIIRTFSLDGVRMNFWIDGCESHFWRGKSITIHSLASFHFNFWIEYLNLISVIFHFHFSGSPAPHGLGGQLRHRDRQRRHLHGPAHRRQFLAG